VVMAAIENDGDALESVSDEFKADREIVMTAVKTSVDGRALKFASDELRADREVVIAAVTQNGRALQYIPDELQTDEEVVMIGRKTYSGEF